MGQREPQRRGGDVDDSDVEPPLVFRTKEQAVYEQLRDWIVHGQLRPGDALDQERLAETFKVSRMPLRQALLMLEGDRLIERQPHHTAVVTRLSAADIKDIYGARSVLEGLLAEMGARGIDERRLARLTDTLAEMTVAVEQADSEQFVKLDRQFHFLLYKASDYPRTIEILEELRSASERYVHFYASSAPSAAVSLDEHQVILDACRAGRPGVVRKLTEKHLMRSAAELLELVAAATAAEAQEEQGGTIAAAGRGASG